MSKSEYNKLVDRNTELIDKMKYQEEEIERLNNIIKEDDKRIYEYNNTIKEVRYNLENSIKSINEKLKNNKEPFEVIDGRIQYINDYRVVRLKAFRTKCKELLEILYKVD